MIFSLGNHPSARVLTVTADPDQDVDAAAEMLDTALRQARVIHLKGNGDVGDDRLDFWAAVNSRIGRIDLRGENPMTLERFSAVWNDIRFDPALATTYRHSNTAQPLHTDGAYNATPPSVGFFFCQAQARQGGRTLFLDVDYLCDILHREVPDLFAELKATPVAYIKGTSPGQRVPIIRQDTYGHIINWNFYRVQQDQGENVKTLSKTFFDFLDRRFVKTGDLAPLHLAAGDCMVFHDLRCVHGREAYSATVAGERCLWNLNLHWDGQAILGSSVN